MTEGNIDIGMIILIWIMFKYLETFSIFVLIIAYMVREIDSCHPVGRNKEMIKSDKRSASFNVYDIGCEA